MAFPDGWSRKCAVTIDADEVDGTLADFPFLLTPDNLPSEMFDADGSNPAQNGGGDIRFSSDAAGTTQLPCEIVYFTTDNDPANGTAQIWVKVPSVSSSVDTTIYVWYGTAGTESQPSVSDTYGRNAVWDDYETVHHLEESANTTSNGYTSATGSGHGTGDGTAPTEAAGKIGTAAVVNNSPTFRIETGTISHGIGTGDFEFSCWVYPYDTSGSFDSAMSNGSYSPAMYGVQNSSNWGGWWGSAMAVSPGLTQDAWQHIAMCRRGTTIYFYVNGVESATTHTRSNSLANDVIRIGAGSTSSAHHLYGRLEECRFSGQTRNEAWYAANYSNQNAPGTFASAGTPEDAGGGGGTNRRRRFLMAAGA